MADEALWFEPVSLLPRCSLSEALLWVWAERVPLYNMEREEHAVSTLQDWECEHLNIPPVPEGTSQAAHYRTEDRLRKKLNSYGRKMPKDSLEYHVSRDMEAGEAVRKWLPLLTIAMELPAAELFLKLRRGQIETMGKILPAGAEIIDFVEQYKSYGRSDFDDLVDSPIPQDYWTMPGIDWLSNALTARGKHYCDVSISVEVLMRLFPGEREPVIGAQFVGNCILVKESTEGSIRPLMPAYLSLMGKLLPLQVSEVPVAPLRIVDETLTLQERQHRFAEDLKIMREGGMPSRLVQLIDEKAAEKVKQLQEQGDIGMD